MPLVDSTCLSALREWHDLMVVRVMDLLNPLASPVYYSGSVNTEKGFNPFAPGDFFFHFGGKSFQESF